MNISFAHWLVLLSGLISITGASFYIRDTATGKTKPNRISWFMWALAPMIATGAAVSAHADIWATSRIFIAGFNPVLVLIASLLNKQSYWKLTAFDFICGICSLLALIFWLVFKSTSAAVLLAGTGDLFAAIPTIKKSWTNPETETGLTYITSLVAGLLILPAIPKWTVENSVFQIYLLIINLALVIVVYRKRLNFF